MRLKVDFLRRLSICMSSQTELAVAAHLPGVLAHLVITMAWGQSQEPLTAEAAKDAGRWGHWELCMRTAYIAHPLLGACEGNHGALIRALTYKADISVQPAVIPPNAGPLSISTWRDGLDAAIDANAVDAVATILALVNDGVRTYSIHGWMTITFGEACRLGRPDIVQVVMNHGEPTRARRTPYSAAQLMPNERTPGHAAVLKLLWRTMPAVPPFQSECADCLWDTNDCQARCRERARVYGREGIREMCEQLHATLEFAIHGAMSAHRTDFADLLLRCACERSTPVDWFHVFDAACDSRSCDNVGTAYVWALTVLDNEPEHLKSVLEWSIQRDNPPDIDRLLRWRLSQVRLPPAF